MNELSNNAAYTSRILSAGTTAVMNISAISLEGADQLDLLGVPGYSGLLQYPHMSLSLAREWGSHSCFEWSM
jgi:hypothetical protein